MWNDIFTVKIILLLHCQKSQTNFVGNLQGLAIQAVRFRFDGQPINETDTPVSLEMEEGDTIEVYQQQTGGWLC